MLSLKKSPKLESVDLFLYELGTKRHKKGLPKEAFPVFLVFEGAKGEYQDNELFLNHVIRSFFRSIELRLRHC